MDKRQARQLVQDTFTHAFDRERFRNFAVNLVNRMDESKAFRRSAQYIKDAFKPHIHRFERLGTYTSPDRERVDILVVHLTHESKLERARTALRNFVADHLKLRDEKDAALVAFVSPTEQQWRFSYIKMEYATVLRPSGLVGVESRLTPARRFSYLVGEGESCHTAQTRFWGILQNTATDPTLADMEEAFSVEVVSDEFFERYAELFETVHAALEALLGTDDVLHGEFEAKSVNSIDFVKKLLGQIVFLYFLQKKGWLGVQKGEDWGSGPRDFLRRLARGDYGEYENFFNDVLEPLFYDTLATDRGAAAWCPHFQCRIPFLNGGLFESLNGYDWQKTDILIPNRFFTNRDRVEEGVTGTGILDVFDRYNFTVNEAEPLEKEVAIDPEMLGQVFEKLIEENRRKGQGAHYTPREIVHYMCEESLINYLDVAVNTAEKDLVPRPPQQAELFGGPKREQGVLKASVREELVPRADIELLIRLGEEASFFEDARTEGTKSYRRHLPKSIETHAQKLDDALKTITVCDPAVGSGAFPVGMMTEVVRARTSLTPYFKDIEERTPYQFKHNAIRHCLYGVDIDAGAVEIAKLRLWLSLVVDEEDPKHIQPLPNLDYKIVVGNSLIELLSSAHLQASSDVERRALVSQLQDAKDRMFNLTSNEEKQRKREKIEQLLRALFEHDQNKLISQIKTKLASLKNQGELLGRSAKEEKEIQKFETEIEELESFQMPNANEHFEWAIHFSDVFQKKQGFDVVIANPPYVRHELFKELKPALQACGYKTYAGMADLLVYFYERGVQLLRDGGTLTMITSNKYYRASYGKKLRHLLVNDLTLKRLIDFGDTPIFDAIAYASILVGVKAKPSEETTVMGYTWEENLSLHSITQTVAERGISIRQSDLQSDSWRLVEPDVLRLLEKLQSKGTPLGKYVDGRLYRGVLTGLNEAFVVDRATRDKLIRDHPSSKEVLKPFLRGRDVKRWRCETQDIWLIFTRRGIDITQYPAIHAYLKQYKKRLMPGMEGGRKAGNYEWYEIQDNIAYWQEFEQPKVVFGRFMNKATYLYDDTGFFHNDALYFVSRVSPFIAAINNSAVNWWFLTQKCTDLQNGYLQALRQYQEQIPIPAASPAEEARLSQLARQAAAQAAAGDASGLRETEREIDGIVYGLFELTAEEIALVEGALGR